MYYIVYNYKIVYKNIVYKDVNAIEKSSRDHWYCNITGSYIQVCFFSISFLGRSGNHTTIYIPVFCSRFWSPPRFVPLSWSHSHDDEAGDLFPYHLCVFIIQQCK